MDCNNSKADSPTVPYPVVLSIVYVVILAEMYNIMI